MTIERLKQVLALPRLRGFEDYEDFERHCRRCFALLPEEYRALYEVLVKLQSLGHDAPTTLNTWQREMTPIECTEFIRVLICVEKMALDSLLKAA